MSFEFLSLNGTQAARGFEPSTILEAVHSHKSTIFVTAPLVSLFLWYFIAWQTSPLKKYPGPFLAGEPLSIFYFIYLIYIKNFAPFQ